MKITSHIIVSGAIAGISYLVTSSSSIAAATFAAGVIIDGDHAIDYLHYWAESKKRPSMADMLSGKTFHQWGKLRVFLHSYELIAVIWGVGLWLGNVPLAAWMTLSYVTHLIADQLSYRLHPLVYFFTFRALSRFRVEKLVLTPNQEHKK